VDLSSVHRLEWVEKEGGKEGAGRLVSTCRRFDRRSTDLTNTQTILARLINNNNNNITLTFNALPAALGALGIITCIRNEALATIVQISATGSIGHTFSAPTHEEEVLYTPSRDSDRTIEVHLYQTKGRDQASTRAR